MDRLFVRLEKHPVLAGNIESLMEEKDWSAQKVAMFIFDQYFTADTGAPEQPRAQSIAITPPKKEKAAVPIEEIVGLYHTYCPDLPQTRKAGATLIKQITARYNEDKDHQSGDWWRQYFSDVAESDFLCGRASDFRASLIWLTKPANMEKVLGGQYINHQAAGVTRAPAQHSQVTQQNISNMTSWLEKKNAEE